MPSEPEVFCMSCGRTLKVNTKVKGFPPDYAKQKLKLACVRAGCIRPVPLYRTGSLPGGPVTGQ